MAADVAVVAVQQQLAYESKGCMAAKLFINDKVKGKMKQNHDSSQSASQSEGAVAEGGRC